MIMNIANRSGSLQTEKSCQDCETKSFFLLQVQFQYFITGEIQSSYFWWHSSDFKNSPIAEMNRLFP